jgi:hypothetical protein
VILYPTDDDDIRNTHCFTKMFLTFVLQIPSPPKTKKQKKLTPKVLGVWNIEKKNHFLQGGMLKFTYKGHFWQ